MQPLHPLIFECSRPVPDPSRVSELIPQVADWDALVAQAEDHGLAPLLHWHLQRAPGGAVPPVAARRLSERFCRNAHRNLRFGAELLRTVAALEGAGIEVLVFKGPAIAWSLYETPALREMCDLDVLVRPADTRRAYELLLSGGCVPGFPGADWRMFHWLSEVSLVRGQVPIDLHWAALPRYLQPVDAGDGAWMRSRRVPVPGGVVRTFSPEDLLLFLAVHGGKHCWTSLNWLADLARLAASPEINWDWVLARARASRISRTLFLSLILIRDLLGCTVPLDVDDSIALSLAYQVSRELRNSSGWPHTMAERLHFTTALAETFPLKALVWWSQVHPTLAEDKGLRLPPSLFPLYYVARPIRLLAKHGARIFRTAPIPRS